MLFSASLYRWGGEYAHHVVCWSYFLSYPLSLLAAFMPDVEWYMLYIDLCHFIIVAVTAWCLIQTKEQPGVRNYAGVALLGFYTLKCMFCIEFSYVSFYMMTCGLLLIFRGVECVHRKIIMSLGVVVFAMGGVIRYDSCIGVLPLIGALACISLFYEHKRGLKLVFLGICVLFVGICYCSQEPLSHVIGSDGSEFSLEIANRARVRFCDYNDDSGFEKTARYLVEGCTVNDLKMYEDGLYYSDSCRNAKYWERLAEIRGDGRVSFSASRFWNLLFEKSSSGSCLRWSVFYFSLFFLSALPPFRRKVRIEASDWILLCGVCVFMILGMRGRVNDRAAMAVYLPCIAMWAMYVRIDLKRRWLHCFVALLSLLILIHYGRSPSFKENYSPFFRASWRWPHLLEIVTSECSLNRNLVYFAAGNYWRDLCLPNSSLMSRDLQLNPNFYPFDGWHAMFPSFLESIKKRGIDEPELILLNPKVRFILRIQESDELVRMGSKRETLLQGLSVMIKCMKEKHDVSLRLEVEKKLADGLYVARVVRVEE